MQRIELEFVKTGHKVEVLLRRRITYITGLSGVGKTTFVNLVFAGSTTRLKAYASLPVYSVTSLTGFGAFMIAQHAILIIDDYASLQSSDFAEYFNKYAEKNDLWVVIVGREDLFRAVPELASDSVYEFNVNDGEFTASLAIDVAEN